jgi:hypothetical protein
MAIAYIDARVIMDRLDEVFGVAGWQDDYTVLPDGSCVCHLKVRCGEHWITKCDVGSESEQKDEHDRRKASFSDALKRAAVKLGIGRYLYRLPHEWVDYDSQKKRIAEVPQLPDWAMPYPVPKEPEPPPEPIGVRTKRKLEAKDAEMAKVGLCKAGELLEKIQGSVAEAKLPTDPTAWTDAHVKVIAGWVKDFEVGAKIAKDTAAPGSRPMTQEEMEELAELMARKGCLLKDVAKTGGAKANCTLEELSVSQGQIIKAMLASKADAKPAKMRSA